MILPSLLALLLMTLLGAAYVKGYDLVRRRSPEHLPQFYLILTTLRMLIVATVAGLYVFFAETKEEAVQFSVILLIMYATMMVVTLKLRH